MDALPTLTLINLDNTESNDEFKIQFEKFCNRTKEKIDRDYVYRMLHTASWFLFARNGNLSEGWLVVSNNQSKISGEKYIRVEFAYSEDETNATNSVERDLEILAKSVGALYIEFYTRFKPIVKHAEKEGYKIEQYVCHKRINY
ncbi:hypothetical protein VPAG_00069 [Vibrio phage douglas 12A4]|uniref:hypothetical protein n=1 Tax=Vibrio phage douglas 12A4 TaxID=573171 RepID=UPI0002C105E7|nr:hypothetical protein VPAG_00069 [Vibrio phage douglas 12A4]AGG58105.1 hypothetical protein VPAG_00069 [Vibrio phage douglas 12A4]